MPGRWIRMGHAAADNASIFSSLVPVISKEAPGCAKTPEPTGRADIMEECAIGCLVWLFSLPCCVCTIFKIRCDCVFSGWFALHVWGPWFYTQHLHKAKGKLTVSLKPSQVYICMYVCMCMYIPHKLDRKLR